MTRPLRVLYLIDGLSPGGAQRQLVTLVEAFDQLLVCPEVAIYHRVHHFLPALEKGGTPVHQLGTRGGRDPRVLLRLARLIRSGEYDLVHTYLTRPGVMARLAAVGRPAPPIVVSERATSLARSRTMILAERVLAHRAAAMIANAEAVRSHVEEHVPAWRGRIDVVPNGIEWSPPSAEQVAAGSRFRSGRIGGGVDLLLVVVARVAAMKNPHLLLDALALLPSETLGRVRVVWVGAGRDERFVADVLAHRESLGLSDRVEFLPPTDDVRSVYLASNAVLLPSVREGFPNAVLEGLAHGRPVVATDVGDAAAMVRHGENGWLVPPGDATAFARAIRELTATTPERRREMGETGSAFVLAEYSAERLAERTMEVYRRVLDG